MTYNFQRPNVPYQGESLRNNDRYQLLTRTVNKPPADDMLDSDFNYLIYAVRQLDTAISQIVSEGIDGSDDPDNADALLGTDGEGNVSWVKVRDRNIIQNSITNLSIYPQTITAAEIQDGTIPAQKLAQDCVTTSKILDQNVTREKLGLLAVGTEQLGLLAVGTEQLADSAVTNRILGSRSVSNDKMAYSSVDRLQLVDLSVTNQKINSKAVSSDKIADNTITFGQISNNFTATKAQQQAASLSSVYVSPATQQYHPSAASAWVRFNGNTGGIVSSYNVSGATKTATGTYRIDFLSAFANTAYACIGTAEFSNWSVVMVDPSFTKTTTQIRVKVYGASTVTNDCDFVNLIFYGNLA